jgi:ferric enterobactin receptor
MPWLELLCNHTRNRLVSIAGDGAPDISIYLGSSAMMRITRISVALIIGLSLSAPLLAQTNPVRPGAGQVPAGPGRITGSVLATEGTQPLTAAAITLRNAADSSLVTGVLTGKDGRFVVDGLPLGRYMIRVSLLGYKPRSSEVVNLTPQATSYDFGQIKLDVAPVQLDAVQAVGERSAVVVEADRTVYNTKNMPVAAGTATDVLRAVPELEVDVNDNVKLRGNQAVAIHINGRPAPLRGEQLANFLKQLPGNRVARVEVMPNPSAKHDPEGMGGIVNIVLKDDLNLGLSGSMSANASTQNSQGVNGRLNYQRGRLTFFTGVYTGVHNNNSSNYDLRTNLIARPITSIEQNGIFDGEGRNVGADWTGELKVGKQAHFWSNAWMYWGSNANLGLTEYGIFNDDVDLPIDRYDRRTNMEGSHGNADVGLGFKQIFQPQKEELTIDGRISRGGNDSENRIAKLFLLTNGGAAGLPDEITWNDIEGNNANLQIQADYFRPLRKGRIDIGSRAWQRNQDDDNLLQIFETIDAGSPRERAHSGYDFDETFYSLYSTVGQTFGKFGANIGLRGEFARTSFQSRVTGQSFDNDYNSVFPSLNVSYTRKPGQSVRLLYSKRIMRPYPFYLNPFVPSADPLNRSVGNPELKPTYTHSFSMDLSYTGTRGTFRIAPYLRKSADVWERIRTVDELGVATNRWENAASTKAYGSNFTISLRPTGKLSGSTNFGVWREVRDGSNISTAYQRRSFMWSAGGNLGYKLTPATTAQMFGSYYPSQYILQGKASGYAHMSLGLRQQVWGTKGSISVNINDPLALNKYNSQTADLTFRQTSRSSFRSRQAYLSLTYNFGKPPQQQSRRTADEGGGGETIRVR